MLFKKPKNVKNIGTSKYVKKLKNYEKCWNVEKY